MPERKSARARKVVDYSKFSIGANDGSDDDFAESSTPPVAKKQKISRESRSKETKLSRHKKEIIEDRCVNRKSIDEKLYERALKDAIDLSLSQSDTATLSQSATAMEDSIVRNQAEDMVPLATSTQNDDTPGVTDSDRTACGVYGPGADVLTVDSDDADDSSDGDFRVADDDDDDDHDDDSSDDDYSSSPTIPVTGNVNKRRAKPCTTKTAKTPVAETTVEKAPPQTKYTVQTAVSSVPSPVGRINHADLTAIHSGDTARVAKLPAGGAVTARSRSLIGERSPLGGVIIKSPSSGLRLGLSRNVRLKPLHSNIKLQN